MVNQITGAGSDLSVRPPIGNSLGEAKPCRLHLKSPTFRSVKDFVAKLSNQFAQEVSWCIREVVETYQGHVRYLPIREEQYTDRHSMSLIASELTCRFPFGNTGTGFLSFDPLLPRCFTNICFGGRISKTGEQAVLSKIDRKLMEKVASRLIKVWLEKWKPVFEGRPTDQVEVEWLSNCASNTGLMKESCLKISFEVEFLVEEKSEAELTLPIHFYLPLLSLECAMFVSSLDKSAMQKTEMIMECSSNFYVLLNSNVSVAAELMRFSLPVKKLKALKVGDVIPIEKPGQARVLIEGGDLGKAEVAQQSGNLVLKISDITMNGDSNVRCH